MKILNHDGFVTTNEIYRLQLWFQKLLVKDFDKWVRDFHIIKWAEELSDLSFLDISEGFRNFQIYRNLVLHSSTLPFPINCNKFKEFCFGLSISSSLDQWNKTMLFESLEKIENKDYFWRKL